jgi:hypothetical protein
MGGGGIIPGPGIGAPQQGQHCMPAIMRCALFAPWRAPMVSSLLVSLRVAVHEMHREPSRMAVASETNLVFMIVSLIV